jgi:hypothetical protein
VESRAVDAQWRKVTHVNWRDPRGDNPVRQRLAAGESVVGSFVRLGCAESVEVCAHAGFDFVVIDKNGVRTHLPVGGVACIMLEPGTRVSHAAAALAARTGTFRRFRAAVRRSHT